MSWVWVKSEPVTLKAPTPTLSVPDEPVASPIVAAKPLRLARPPQQAVPEWLRLSTLLSPGNTPMRIPRPPSVCEPLVTVYADGPLNAAVDPEKVTPL